MDCSCPCTVCAQPAPKKELIAERLAWREPLDAIAGVLDVSILDLSRHSADDSKASFLRKTDFPFFENAGFLFLGPESYEYLVWIVERVKRPVRKSDEHWCKLVGFVADSFLRKSNLQNFADYSARFTAARMIVDKVRIAETPDEVFLSDAGLNSLSDHWLTEKPMPGRRSDDALTLEEESARLVHFDSDWERIRTYGHGAVTLHQIAFLADKEISEKGMRIQFHTEESKSRWAERVVWQWYRLRFWGERIMPVFLEEIDWHGKPVRKKRPIDIAYHALRVSSPFNPPGALALRQKVEKLKKQKGKLREQKKDLSSEDSDEFKKAQAELSDIYRPFCQDSKLTQYANDEIQRGLKPLIRSRRYENTPLRKCATRFPRSRKATQSDGLQHDEIVSICNMAIGKAVDQDRADTPAKDWYLKVWRDFERGWPAPIIQRVRQDIADQLKHEWIEVNATRGLTRDAMRDIPKGKFRPGDQIRPGVYRAEGSETAEEWKLMRMAPTVLETVTFKEVPYEFERAEMRVMKDQVCETPRERAIWQAKIDDPGSRLDQLQARVFSETGEDLSVQRISQIASKLKKRGNKLKFGTKILL